MNILQKAIRSMYSLTGSFNDKLLKYYKQYGATSSVLQDAEKQYLVGRLGAKYLTNQDYWKELDAQFGDGLPLEVSDILRKYGDDAHLYLPGIGRVSGFEAGNYFDSSGTTHASVDGSVGLMLDAAGSVGVDVIVNGGFNSAVSWDTPSNAWVIADGKASTTASVININQSLPIALQYKTIQVEFDLVVVSGSIRAEFGGGNGATATATGKYSTIIKAINADRFLYIYGVTPFTGSIDNVVVREVTGIHATQSTPGYKPTLRKGIVNLLTWSNDLTNAAWSKLNATVAAGQNDPYGGTSAFLFAETSANNIHRASQNFTASAQGYTFACIAKQGVGTRNFGLKVWDGTTDRGTSFNLQAGTIVGTISTIAAPASSFIYDIGNGYYLCGITISAAAGAGDVTIWNLSGSTMSYAGDGVSGNVIYRYGLFQGTLTAAQILANGGIPLTTTAPASSQAGVNYLEFGGDDYLTFGAVPFQMADDHCVVVAASPNAITSGADQDVFAIRGTTATPICGVVRFAADGFIKALYRDDAGTLVFLTGPAYVAGGKYVIAVRKVGNVRTLWVNGVIVATDSTVFGATTLSTATIGCSYYGSAIFTAFVGKAYSVNPVKGTLTDADVLTESKFAASLAGIQL